LITYDPIEVQNYILSQRGNKFLDIGAGLGFYTLKCAPNFNKVISFEPCLENYMQILKSCPSNVIVLNIALSSTIGVSHFFSHGSWDLGSLTRFSPSSTSILTLTLDILFPNQFFDFCKIDTEGAEHLILTGARTVTFGKFMIECHGNEEEVRKCLDKKYNIVKEIQSSSPFFKSHKYLIGEIK